MYKGIIPTLKQIHNEEGVRGLFRGLGPSLLTVPLFWGIWWCTYDYCKEALGVAPGEAGKAWQHGVSAVCAAGLSDVVTQPLWVVRTRSIALVFHSEEKALLNKASTFKLMHYIVKKEGVTALYRGLSASLFGLSHVVIQLPLYEALKDHARQRNRLLRSQERRLPALPSLQSQTEENAQVVNQSQKEELHVTDVVVASTVSKLLASAATYPHELVRARLQDSRSAAHLLSTAKQIYQREGLVGFYQGIRVSLLRVLPSTVVTFVAYESLIKLLDKW